VPAIETATSHAMLNTLSWAGVDGVRPLAYHLNAPDVFPKSTSKAPASSARLTPYGCFGAFGILEIAVT